VLCVETTLLQESQKQLIGMMVSGTSDRPKESKVRARLLVPRIGLSRACSACREGIPMAKSIRLKESQTFLHLEYVPLATEQEDGSVAVNIVDQDKTQLIKDNDAINLLAFLKMEAKK
jgi:hypothetical protein